MADSIDDFSPNGDDLGEAGLFEAISHETRIHTLFELRNGPVGFTELRRRLGISSSGNMQHHIRKLGPLIHLNGGGLYALTDQGREALLAITAVRSIPNQVKYKLNMLLMIGILVYYIVQMNIPFLLGNVTLMTPLHALTTTAIFGAIFYALFTIWFRIITEQRFNRHFESD